MSKPWFKLKRYGYGWQPASRMGWLLTAWFGVYAGVATACFGYLMERLPESNGAQQAALWVLFLSSLATVTSLFIVIARITAGKAGWRWGDDD